MMRHLVFPVAAVLAFACGAACFADEPGSHNAHVLPQPATEAAVHLIVDAVLPGPLAKGAAVLPFRIENMKIMPLYGQAALDVAPRIGHLHITVDDAPWHWVHADNEPIVIQGLAAGLHHITVDLADPIHRVVESKTVSFEIP
jgi:Family of unknown function (DUF6130)